LQSQKNGVWGGWIASSPESAHLLQRDAIRAGESPIRFFLVRRRAMTSTTPAVKQSTTAAVRITDPWTVLRQEMNDLFAGFWNGNAGGPGVMSPAFAPSLDLAEKDNCYELHIDVPGMEAKDLDIQVHGNTVTVSGNRKEEKEDKGKTYHRVERRSGSFSRTITLPCEVDTKEVAAEYTNGVLNVVLPKCEKAKLSKISIKS
jgi:HSP20 family protein